VDRMMISLPLINSAVVTPFQLERRNEKGRHLYRLFP
jgi:hypothetical protein